MWGPMSAADIGELCFIDGIMNHKDYIIILQTYLQPRVTKMRTKFRKMIQSIRPTILWACDCYVMSVGNFIHLLNLMILTTWYIYRMFLGENTI